MVSVRNIDADFEKANLLKAIAEKNIETPDAMVRYYSGSKGSEC